RLGGDEVLDQVVGVAALGVPAAADIGPAVAGRQVDDLAAQRAFTGAPAEVLAHARDRGAPVRDSALAGHRGREAGGRLGAVAARRAGARVAGAQRRD